MSAQAEQHEGLSRPLGGLLLAAAVWILAALASSQLVPLGARFVEGLELKSLDALFQVRRDFAPTQVRDDIAIVTVDESALDLFEHAALLSGAGTSGEVELTESIPWPWPRQMYGFAAEYLQALGARAVFFDFLFSGGSIRQSLDIPDDEEFAASCERAGNVYQAMLFLEGDEAASGRAAEIQATVLEGLLAQFPADLLAQTAIEAERNEREEFRFLKLPIGALGASAKGMGAINAHPDPDGIVRRVRLLYDFRESTYPSIHLSLAADLAGGAAIGLDADGEHITVGDARMPVDEASQLLVNWHGPEESYPHHSLAVVIGNALKHMFGEEALLDPADFRDKVILVGTSAAGLHDLVATPFSSSYPGVEVHATVLDNILSKSFLERPSRAARLGILALLLVVGAQLMIRRQSAQVCFLWALFATGAYAACTLYAFIARTQWIDVALPSISLATLFAGSLAVQYFTEGRQKKQIRNAFQRYLPPTVVDEVLKVPVDELKLGGDRRDLTVYFSDIQSFTSISESLAPEELVSMLNIYLSEMSDIISVRHGTLDKYIGDCIMAFWGAPLAVENGALDACEAALENQARMITMRAEFKARGLPELYARIGINTGPMLVGNMGSEQHFSYTVMGDAVNLASRLEGANKQYGTYIMLGEGTWAAAKDAIETRELDLLRVKGKSEPERVRELMGLAGGLTETQKRLREKYVGGLEAYRMRDWAGALARFDEALELVPQDGPSVTYRDRCTYYRESPPPEDWNGVYEMKTK